MTARHLDAWPAPHIGALVGSTVVHAIALLLLQPWGSLLPSIDEEFVAVDLTIDEISLDEPEAVPELPPQEPAEEAITIPSEMPRPRTEQEEGPGDAGPEADAGPTPDAGPDASLDGGTAVAEEILDGGPMRDGALAAAGGGDGGPAADAGVVARRVSRGRSEGLARSLPAFVRVAVVVQAEAIRDSPHANAARKILRRATGLGDDADPLADLEELVIVTANPYNPRSTAAAARASREAGERPDAGLPTGWAGQGDAGTLRRGRREERPPEKLPPGAGRWRDLLVALAHPETGDRPAVSVLAIDLAAITRPEHMGPPAERIELRAWDLPDGGARAEATAHFETDAETDTAQRFWEERLRWAKESPWIALIGLRPLTRVVRLEREGRTLRAEVTAGHADVRAALAVLETAFRRQRRPRPPAEPTKAP